MMIILKTTYRIAFWLGLFSSFSFGFNQEVLATFNDKSITLSFMKDYAEYLGEKNTLHNDVFLEQAALFLSLSQAAFDQGLDQQGRYLDLWQTEYARFAQSRLRAYYFEKQEVSQQQIDAAVASGDYRGRPTKFRLRQIFKKYLPNMTDVQKNTLRLELQAIRKKVSQGASFEALAEKHSDSQTRFRGGLLGNVTPADLDSRLHPFIFKLKPGQCSELVGTKEGVMIFYLESIVPAVNRSIEEQRENALAALKRNSFNAWWDENLDHMEKKIQINTDAFKNSKATPVATFGNHSLTKDQMAWRLKREKNVKSEPWMSLETQRITEVITGFCLELQFIDAYQTKLAKKPDHQKRFQFKQRQFWSLRVLERAVAERFEEPKDAVLKAEYEANKGIYRIKPKYQLEIIGWDLDKENIRAKNRLAQAVRSKILKGELSFADAAKQYSELKSAAEGGSLGWVSRPRVAVMGKHLLMEVSRLKEASLSGLVRQDQMLYLLNLKAIQPERQASFEESRKRIMKKVSNRILSKLQAEVEKDWLENIQFAVVKTK